MHSAIIIPLLDILSICSIKMIVYLYASLLTLAIEVIIVTLTESSNHNHELQIRYNFSAFKEGLAVVLA